MFGTLLLFLISNPPQQADYDSSKTIILFVLQSLLYYDKKDSHRIHIYLTQNPL